MFVNPGFMVLFTSSRIMANIRFKASDWFLCFFGLVYNKMIPVSNF